MRLFVLDVDDTLYLERDYVRSGFVAVGARIAADTGVSGLGAKAWNLFQSGARGNIFNLLLDAAPEVSQHFTIDDLITLYREHRPDIRLTPDSRRFIDSIDAMNPIAIITDGPVASQRAKLVALGADSFASSVVVTGEHGPEWTKPSALAFEHLQASFGVDPASCTYYADNPHKDFIAPRQLGWHSVRIRRSGGLHADVATDGGAEITVASFDELAATKAEL